VKRCNSSRQTFSIPHAPAPDIRSNWKSGPDAGHFLFEPYQKQHPDNSQHPFKPSPFADTSGEGVSHMNFFWLARTLSRYARGSATTIDRRESSDTPEHGFIVL